MKVHLLWFDVQVSIFFLMFSQGLENAPADVRDVFKEIQDLEKATQSNQVIMFVYNEIIIFYPSIHFGLFPRILIQVKRNTRVILSEV